MQLCERGFQRHMFTRQYLKITSDYERFSSENKGVYLLKY